MLVLYIGELCVYLAVQYHPKMHTIQYLDNTRIQGWRIFSQCVVLSKGGNKFIIYVV